jgi:hypothetical protein
MKLVKRTLHILVIALLLTSFFVSSVLTASAEATATETTFTCDHFSASGTSDQPYVTIWVANDETHEQFLTIIPVTGGTFSGTLNFPAVADGTEFEIEVWGTPDPDAALYEPGYWDEDPDFFYALVNCGPTPLKADACVNPLPDGSVVYDVPLGAPAYFNPDLQSAANFNLPAGTWKISEFKDGFAKVWIACQATPIWIPKSAVGDAIG